MAPKLFLEEVGSHNGGSVVVTEPHAEQEGSTGHPGRIMI
jgi:hypothetical protein